MPPVSVQTCDCCGQEGPQEPVHGSAQLCKPGPGVGFPAKDHHLRWRAAASEGQAGAGLSGWLQPWPDSLGTQTPHQKQSKVFGAQMTPTRPPAPPAVPVMQSVPARAGPRRTVRSTLSLLGPRDLGTSVLQLGACSLPPAGQGLTGSTRPRV